MKQKLSAMKNDSDVVRKTVHVKRYAVCVGIITVSIIALHALYSRLVSQVYYQKAKQYQKNGYLGLAIRYFKTGASYQPRDTLILNRLAESIFKLSVKDKSANETLINILKAKEVYQQASRYNPLDAETAYGLTRVESKLEQLYDIIYPDKKNNPYHPLPYLERAVQLRPNSVTCQYALARYFFDHDDKQTFYRHVYNIIRIYPPAYNYLKKEPMWSSEIKKVVGPALMDAIQKGILTENAHRLMSDLLVEDKDWPNAIKHYQKALENRKGNISEKDYMNMGRLFLKNNQAKDAETNFIMVLDESPNIESVFSNISRIYRDDDRIEEYISFCQNAAKHFSFSSKMHITSARYLIDLKQYRRAERILMDLNMESPIAEAYYWLARIAEYENVFDEMELNIQKATVLDPSNMKYRRMFYGLLIRLGKYETAEREIGLMIQYSETPSSHLYDKRAKLRRRQNDYAGAVEDWKAAIELAPENAAFCANIAESYMKLGNLSLAIKYYKKAVNLEPGNKNYAGKYRKLKGGAS